MTGHEAGSRGCRDRAAGIGRRHAHTLSSQAVDVGRAEMLLTVAGEVAVAQVVAHDIQDVRPLAGGTGSDQQGQQRGGQVVEVFVHLRAQDM